MHLPLLLPLALVAAVPVGALQLLFKVAEHLAEHECHDEVDDAHDDQRLDGQVRGAFDHQVLGHQVADEEGGAQGRVLDDHDELVAQGGEDVLHRLGHHHEPHGLALAEAQAQGRLLLAGVNGLDAGTDDLGHVGRAVADEGDGDAEEFLLGQGRDQHGQAEVEKVQLQQHGRAADDLDVDGGEPAQGRDLGHLHQGQQRGEHRAEGHGDGRQGQGVLHAVDEKLVPVFQEQGGQLFKVDEFHGGFLVLVLYGGGYRAVPAAGSCIGNQPRVSSCAFSLLPSSTASLYQPS